MASVADHTRQAYQAMRDAATQLQRDPLVKRVAKQADAALHSMGFRTFPTKPVQGALVGILLGALGAAVKFLLTPTPGPNVYMVLVESNSNRTALHVFSFYNDYPERPQLQLHGEEVWTAEPAMGILPRLATFSRKKGQTMKEVGTVPETLKPLLHEARTHIPFMYYDGVPVTIRYRTGTHELQQRRLTAVDWPEEAKRPPPTAVDQSHELSLLPAVREVQKAGLGPKEPVRYDKDTLEYTQSGQMDAESEALRAWVGVNYMLHRLGGEWTHTVAVLDVGWLNTTYFVYAANPEHKRGTTAVNVFNATYNLAVNVFEGYGFMAQRVKMARSPLGTLDDSTHVCAPALFEGGCSREKLVEPCLPVGKDGGCGEHMCHGMEVGEGYLVRGSREGATFPLCTHLAVQALDIAQPGDTERLGCTENSTCYMGLKWASKRVGPMPVYALSHLHRRPEQALRLARPKEEGAAAGAPPSQIKITATQLARAATKICSTPMAHVRQEYASLDMESDTGDPVWLCTDISHLHALLVHGLGIDPDHPIHVVGDSPPNHWGVRLSMWMLGDALLALDSVRNTNNLTALVEERDKFKKKPLPPKSIYATLLDQINPVKPPPGPPRAPPPAPDTRVGELLQAELAHSALEPREADKHTKTKHIRVVSKSKSRRKGSKSSRKKKGL